MVTNAKFVEFMHKPNMIKIVLLFITLILINGELFAQSVTSSFNIPASVCLEENIQITNTSSNADTYLWDFCLEDLDGTPTAENYNNLAGGNIPVAITIVYDSTLWYGFVSSRNNHQLYRLDFGNSLENDPTIVPLGNIDGIFNKPKKSIFIKEGGAWYAIMIHQGGILRLSFSDNLSSTLIGQDFGTFGVLSNPAGLDIVEESGNYYAIISDFGNNKLVTVDFGNSITNNPMPGDVYDLGADPSVSGSYGIELEKEGAVWYGVLASYSNGKIFRLSFNLGLTSPPSFGEIETMTNPFSVKFLKEGLKYYAIINNSSSLLDINFGSSISDPFTTNTTTFPGIISSMEGFNLTKSNPNWYGFGINYNTNDLYRFRYPDLCAMGIENSTIVDANPSDVKYSVAGNYAIELVAYDSYGNKDYATQSLTVTSGIAPDIDFSTTNQCVDSPNNFTAINISGDITAYSWDFDQDGIEDSNQPSPDYSFGTTGSHSVVLTVNNASGCINNATKSITIYNAPTTLFTPPGGSLCSNTSLTFTNTSTYDIGSPVSWSWDFSGEGTSTAESPSFNFSTGGAKTITLTATLADGCTSTSQQIINLAEGPSIDFSWSNNCFGDGVQFINNSETMNVTYNWDFGDGSPNSIDFEPVHSYAIAGDYDVILSVTNMAGCMSLLTKTISVNEQPLADFTYTEAVENFSVDFSGQDLTLPGDNIVSWSWDFDGMDTSTDQSPVFTFSTPGNYLVSLAIVTGQGCSEEIIKTVTVSEAEKPTTNFSLQPLICLGENLNIQNTTINADTYLWDFCLEDLGSTPKAENYNNLAGGNIPVAITIVYDSALWYGFVSSRNNHQLFRMDFGNSLENDPTIVPLGNIDGIFNEPKKSIFIKEGGSWYAIMIHQGGILRLSFPDNLASTPIGQDFGTFGVLSNPAGLDVVEESGNYYAIISDFGNNKLVTIDFGNSITNNPMPGDVYDLGVDPSVSGSYGIGLEKEGAVWYGVLASYSNGKIFRLTFGSGLITPPSFDEIGSLTNPFSVKFLKEGLKYYAIINNSSSLLDIDFGNSIADPFTTNTTTFQGIISTMEGFELTKSNPKWYGFGINYITNDLYRFMYPDLCAMGIENSTIVDANPSDVTYSVAGNYAIELVAYDSYGNKDNTARSLVVTSDVAPDIDFSTINICRSNQNTFTASSSNDPSILSWQWDFGDGNTAIGQNTTHQFLSTGTYPVRLTINDGTCGNTLVQEISIFEEPIPDFIFPAGTNCSNSETSFTNTTIGPPDSVIVWSWDFDGIATSSQKDTVITFLTGGQKTITLTASIPGCITSVQKNLNIEAGPAIDFDFTDVCHTNDMQFINLTTGDGITTINWDFGDGNSAVGISDPSNFYSNPGTYSVTLSVENNLGCVNQISKSVNVHSNPGTDFFNELSCARDSTQFIDQTLVNNANIVSWEWDFGDPTSAANQSSIANPAHLYSDPGNYIVKLVTTSNYGCQDSTTFNVEVLPTTITADFTWERNCVMDSVNFHNTSELADGVNATDYIWDVDGETLTGTDPKFQFLIPGIHQVSLSLALDNFCSGFVSKSIDVAEELLPGFDHGTLCLGQVSQFQDTTSRQGDDIVGWQWNIDGETITTQIGMLDHIFQETGTQMVSLTVTTANGCDQFISKSIVVNEVPNPRFETSIDFGATPLTVDFTNTTQDADLFQWTFQDPNDTRSSARDTTFIFDVLGDYNVTLEATNEFGCKQSVSKLIQVVVPDLEVELENVNLVEDNGNLKIVLSIVNNGTVTIDEMDILINLGALQFVESFSGAIIPRQSNNYTLDFKIPNLTKEQLEFVCFELKPLNQYIESDTSNNEICVNFENRPLIFNPFPNPAKDQIRISLLIPETKKVDFSLINSRGESVLEKTVNDIPTGLNTITLETTGFNPGLYLLQVTYENTSELFRVVIR